MLWLNISSDEKKFVYFDEFSLSLGSFLPWLGGGGGSSGSSLDLGLGGISDLTGRIFGGDWVRGCWGERWGDF